MHTEISSACVCACVYIKATVVISAVKDGGDDDDESRGSKIARDHD